MAIMITLRWTAGNEIQTRHDASEMAEALARPGAFLWLDLQAPDEQEMALLHDPLNFHPLAVEDAMTGHQRPKLEEYDDHFFLVVHEVEYARIHPPGTEQTAKEKRNPENWRVHLRQVAVFVRNNIVVTVHKQPSETIGVLADRCAQRLPPLQRGVDYFLYALLDGLVDRCFPIIDSLDDQIDTIENRILRLPRQETLNQLFVLKRNVIALRKLVGPTADVVRLMMTHNFPAVRSEIMPYLRDVSDHLTRMYEILDSQRDLLNGALDVYLSTINNQMSLIMQRLTIVSVIFLPLTFLTGFFGMNFKVSPWMPAWDRGEMFWIVFGLFVAAGAGMTWWFSRKRLL